MIWWDHVSFNQLKKVCLKVCLKICDASISLPTILNDGHFHPFVNLFR